MKKIIFTFCLFLGAHVQAKDPKDGESFKFGYIPEMKMWEKNATNMQNKVSWTEFQKVQNVHPDLFSEYTFGKDKYVKLPGFGSVSVNGNKPDGNCLLTHLGIKPEKLYNVLADTATEIQTNIIENKNSQNYYDSMIIELISFLDPKEDFVLENVEPFEALETLIKKSDQLRVNWLKNIEEHGGTEFMNNGKQNAMRPLNSDAFFQVVSNTLKVNIVIFNLDDQESTLLVSRQFTPNLENFPDQLDTLYLMSDKYGMHYDVLTQKNNPVSQPVFEEIKFYIDFIKGNSRNLKKITGPKEKNKEEQKNEEEQYKENVKKLNVERIRKARIENTENNEEEQYRGNVKKMKAVDSPPGAFTLLDADSAYAPRNIEPPRTGINFLKGPNYTKYLSNESNEKEKSKNIPKSASDTYKKEKDNKSMYAAFDDAEDEGWSVEALIDGKPKNSYSKRK
jgi:hypothetical protein